MDNRHLIDLVGISKEYSGEYALNNIDLYIRNGEFLTLLGPSGCGKTTMLRIIAGFSMPSEGTVLLDGKDMKDVPPYKRKVNTVFQKYALFPHLNVFDNVAFGLKLKKYPPNEYKRRLSEITAEIGLIKKERKAAMKAGDTQKAEKLVEKLRELIIEGAKQRVAQSHKANDIKQEKRNVAKLIDGLKKNPNAGSENTLPALEKKRFDIIQREAEFFGQHIPKHEIKRRVELMLELVNLKGFGGRYIDQLSGGQQQRVAIARALVNNPEVLLLDEPLGALDLKLRKGMQLELKKMQQSLGITFIYVTHDQEEALTMSDTIVVMNSGVIQQIGTPEDIYNEPKNTFVAQFIGESNIIDGEMLGDYLVKFGGVEYKCLDKGFAKNEAVDVVVRPEDVDIVPIGEAMISGVITNVTFMGVHYAITVDCGVYTFLVHTTDFVDVGEKVGLCILPDAIHVMKKQIERTDAE